MQQWAWKNAKSIQEAAPFVKEAKFLGVSLEFCAEAKRFLTLDGRSKKIDVDNRIKASVDAVFKLLNCDDSKVWSLTSRKLIVPKGEFLSIKIVDLDAQED